MATKIMSNKQTTVQLEYSLPVIGSFVPLGMDVVDIHKTIVGSNGATLHLSLNPNSMRRILEMNIEGLPVNAQKWMYASDAIIEEVEYGVGRTIKYRHGKQVMGSLWLS